MIWLYLVLHFFSNPQVCLETLLNPKSYDLSWFIMFFSGIRWWSFDAQGMPGRWPSRAKAKLKESARHQKMQGRKGHQMEVS